VSQPQRLDHDPEHLGVVDLAAHAAGPGSDRVRGQIDNTEVFRVMVEALGLGHGE